MLELCRCYYQRFSGKIRIGISQFDKPFVTKWTSLWRYSINRLLTSCTESWQLFFYELLGMAILKMILEEFERLEGRMSAEGAAPFNAVDLEFMTKPGATISKYFQVTFFECADVWFKVLEYMFSAEIY